jgi:hypothetical protein
MFHLRRFTTPGKRWPPAVALAAMVSIAACGAGGRAAIDAIEQVDVPSAHAVSVRVILRAEHAAQSGRYWSAVRTALKMYADRFGTMPFTSLTVVDPGWPPSWLRSGDEVTIAAPTRWLAFGSTMGPEIAVTRAIGDAFWRRVLSCGAGGSAWLDGLNRLTSTPVIAAQFVVQQTPPAYSYVEERYFGAMIPWVLRVPLRNATIGNGLKDYLLNPGVDVRRAVNEADHRAAVAKTALALGTLERWIGAPTWDAVLAEFAAHPGPPCPSPADLERVASRVTGLDLSWFFAQAFASNSVFDYGVEQLTSEPVASAASLYRTTVVVRRYGDAIFAGTGAPRVGSFESGRGIEVRVAFADGSERVDYWDGRDRLKSFVYESPSPGRSAAVDPGYVILLDVNRTNNSRTTAPAAPRAATRWAARWATWLQDLLLTYALLV